MRCKVRRQEAAPCRRVSDRRGLLARPALVLALLRTHRAARSAIALRRANSVSVGTENIAEVFGYGCQKSR